MRTTPSVSTRRTGRTAQTAPPTQPSTLDATTEDSLPGAATDRAERVRLAAYALYEQRGCGDGHDFDDWLMAETLVDRELADNHDEEAPMV